MALLNTDVHDVQATCSWYCSWLMNGVDASLRIKFTNHLHYFMTSRITNILLDHLVQVNIASILWTNAQGEHLFWDILQKLIQTSWEQSWAEGHSMNVWGGAPVWKLDNVVNRLQSWILFINYESPQRNVDRHTLVKTSCKLCMPTYLRKPEVWMKGPRFWTLTTTSFFKFA